MVCKSSSRIYRIFHEMKSRCERKKHCGYKWYGGKGIKVLRKTFDDFYNDMGESYQKHVEKYGEKDTSIDRIDSNGNYCKENCKWSTRSEQGLHKCSTKKYLYKGKEYTRKDIVNVFNISLSTIYRQIKKGKDISYIIQYCGKVKKGKSIYKKERYISKIKKEIKHILKREIINIKDVAKICGVSKVTIYSHKKND